ncbi:MAG: hypothetical protein MZW92_01720 [Comamonadaceae bacterium]|nr:hypothetical protein [Comamonadaceae bacterium]
MAVARAAGVAPVVVLLGRAADGQDHPGPARCRCSPDVPTSPSMTSTCVLRPRLTRKAWWPGHLRLVLDEVQRARELLIAVKRAVDQDPGRPPWPLRPHGLGQPAHAGADQRDARGAGGVRHALALHTPASGWASGGSGPLGARS